MAELIIAGEAVRPGQSRRIELPTVSLYTDTTMSMPIFVKRGKRAGPNLFVCAAVHGDELNGIEIISRLIHSRSIARLRGTLIAVPFVNGYGVLNQSRYLPDRRDLNRYFPGSERGSMAARIAHLFVQEIVTKCQYGIDLHTGALHRSNLPQIRANLDDAETLAMARAFGVPVLLNSTLRDGSLRECADQLGVKMILYEAGQALRFDELSIRAGVNGILQVMRHLGMLGTTRARRSALAPVVARSSGWVRATESGFVVHRKELGDRVEPGDVLAYIKGPFGDVIDQVLATDEGIVIGKQNIPLVQEGEAMYHIAYFSKPEGVAEHIELFQEELIPDLAPAALLPPQD